MIEPNLDLFLWIVFILYGIIGIGNIIAGAIGGQKSKNYGVGDVLLGLIMLIVCFVVCVF